MINFIIGFCLGMFQVGAHSYKLISVIDRRPIKAAISSCMVSFVYFFSIKVVIDNEIGIYLGFSVGAAMITAILSMRPKDEDALSDESD